jgi:uncharacterized protein YhbP (UPF0306 family)
MIHGLHEATKASHHFTDRQRRMYNFLAEQRIGVLCTVTPDYDPHGAVVYYAIDENFVIRILTKTGTRKYDNMKHHNRVMLTVFEPLTQTTAQVHGIASERGGSANISKVARDVFSTSTETSNTGLPPIVKLQAGSFTTFQIEPVQIHLAIYARPEPGGYKEIFESIESFDLRGN